MKSPRFDYSADEVLASLCRSSLYDFLKTFWHYAVMDKPVYNWHIEYLCGELQTIAERVFRGDKKEYDLVVNIAPGTTKSLIFSIMFPAWVWTRMPHARVITASYAFTLAVQFSRKSRDIVLSDLYQRLFPDIKLRDDQNSKHHYVNTQGGERYATGIDGMLLGMHGHFHIVDDPVTTKQTLSALELANANRFMEEVLPSRKTDKEVTVMALVMQRLAENDPAGERLAQADKLPARHVCLPGELTDEVKPVEARAYYVDGLMDPVRLGEIALAEAEAKGDFYYASQILQHPIPRGTATFLTERLKIHDPPGKYKRVVRAWDKAGTLFGGAFTVGTKIAEDFDGRYWVLDVRRVQLDSGKREALIRRTAQEDGKKVRVVLEEEPGSGGKQSAQGSVRNLAGFTVTVVKVGRSDGDKETRADAFSAQVNVGNVSLAPGHWNRDYVHELNYFPRSKYKDQVDSSSLGFNAIAGRKIRVGGLGS